MSYFIGRMCPSCKGVFMEDDDIVVCSDCQKPHHRKCWVRNHGCTTSGCLGTISGIYEEETDAAAQEVESTVICSSCGAANSANAVFCNQCGSPMNATQEQKVVTEEAPQVNMDQPITQETPLSNAYVSEEEPAPQSNAYQPVQNAYQPVKNTYQPKKPEPKPLNPQPRQPIGQAYGVYHAAGTASQTPQTQTAQAPTVTYNELSELVEKNTEYYIPKFQELRSQEKKTSWNWPAFLITPYWMIYRKMYGYGAAALAVGFLLSMSGNTFFSLVALAGYIAMGIFGNYIYMNHLEKRVQHAKTLSQYEGAQYLANNTGVNTLAAVLTAVGYAIFISIVTG